MGAFIGVRAIHGRKPRALFLRMGEQMFLALLHASSEVVAQGFQLELLGDLFHRQSGALAGHRKNASG